jgi:hypothetical protein
MNNVFEKLDIRGSDYVAAIDVEDDNLLSQLYHSCKGLVCAGRAGTKRFDGMKEINIFDKPNQIDDDVFGKVVVNYGEDLNLKGLVRISENKALVLICGVPQDKKEIFESILDKKAGITECWDLVSDQQNCVDFLFKVRKY